MSVRRVLLVALTVLLLANRLRAQGGESAHVGESAQLGGTAAPDTERLRAAKAFFFDRKYAEAREAWKLIAQSGGGEAESALYWIARCSESLGESARALKEYGQYLGGEPRDRILVEEAHTGRIGLAARLYKAGQKQHLPILLESLRNTRRAVRYAAAFQLSTLGADVGQPAVPVLCRVLAEEKDDDLVERAKLGLLRLDARALSQCDEGARRPPPSREASWIKVRIYRRGISRPEVSVNMPVALAELVFKSLPDDARTELKRKGFDADNFWERLKKLGPTQILEINGEDGERIQIWIE